MTFLNYVNLILILNIKIMKTTGPARKEVYNIV